MAKNYIEPKPKTMKIEFENGLDLAEKFMEKCKEIDSGLTRIAITMKGENFSREISRSFKENK